MDKRIIKFIIISALCIIAAYWAAWKLDTFGTAIVVFVPICYFFYKGLNSLKQLIKKKEVRTNLIIGVVSIITCMAMAHSFILSDLGLQELTKQRMQTLSQLRPVLLKYKEERGAYPSKLQDLVPNYLQGIPPELLNDGKNDGYKKITYEIIKCEEAQFVFFRKRGPDSSVTYHVSENRYEYDK